MLIYLFIGGNRTRKTLYFEMINMELWTTMLLLSIVTPSKLVVHANVSEKHVVCLHG
jgi:hypothetical protein